MKSYQRVRVHLLSFFVFFFVLINFTISSFQSAVAQSNLFDEGEITHSVKPGYSSSYLPTKRGPLVNESYLSTYGDYIKERQPLTLAKRFDQVRDSLLVSPARVFDPSTKSIPLEEFFKAVGYNPGAEGWEGKCHQWSAAASDENIKQLIGKVEASGGLLCDGQVFTKGDVQELVTASYATSKDEAFFGSRANKPADFNESVNRVFRETVLGEDTFSPLVFHEKMHSYLKNGQSVVLDLDSGAQVWNHPVFEISSKIDNHKNIPESLVLLDLSYFDIPESAQDSVKEIKQMREMIDRILSGEKDYNSATKLSDLLPDGMELPADFLEIVAEWDRNEIGMPDELQYKLENLAQYIQMSLAMKFEAAREKGLKLKDQYQVKAVETHFKYLIEGNFRDEDLNKAERTYRYAIVEKVKDDEGRDLPAPQVVTTYWIGDRPDFAWVPFCQTKVCHQNATKYKKYLRQMPLEQMVRTMVRNESLGLDIALSDLLNIFGKNACLPLKEMDEKVKGLVTQIKEQGFPEDPMKLQELRRLNKEIKSLKVPLDVEALKGAIENKSQFSIDSEGYLEF